MSSSATAQLSTNDHFGQESWVLLEKGRCMPHKYSIISTVREYRSTAAKRKGREGGRYRGWTLERREESEEDPPQERKRAGRCEREFLWLRSVTTGPGVSNTTHLLLYHYGCSGGYAEQL